MPTRRMLEAALSYAKMGLALIPLHGKRPYFENWTEVATDDPGTITRWWTQEPDANIGLATGPKSRVFVLDVDPRHGGNESLETLINQHGHWPETWEQVTGGGGRHVFFRYPAFPVKNMAGLFPGIDIRGEGGQVVIPPSIHPETKRVYSWDGLAAIEEMEPAEAPQWLSELLHSKAREIKKSTVQVPLRIPKGVQHHTLVSLAGALRKIGLNESEIFQTLWTVNNERCEDPGPQRNIQQIAHSMMRYAPSDRDLFTTASKLWRMTRAFEVSQEHQQQAMQPLDGLSILRSKAPEPVCIVHSLLYNGLTIFAGRPKVGKSWLTLQLAITVASGGVMFGVREVLRPGRVAYFALEESQTRTSSRMRRLVPNEDATLANIEFLYKIEPLLKGGDKQLDAYLGRVQPNLVIIDTLLALVQASSHRDVLRSDYQEVNLLRLLAERHKTSILVVHHLRKEGGSGLDAVAGTTGVTAAADCIWTLRRQPEGQAVMEATGRDIEQQTLVLQLDLSGPFGWTLVSQGEDAIMTEERELILDVLTEHGALAPKRIAAELGKSGAAIRMLLKKMVRAGLLAKKDGMYRVAN